MNRAHVIILGLHFGALCIVLARAMRRDRLAGQPVNLRHVIEGHLRRPTLRSYASLPGIDLAPHHR